MSSFVLSCSAWRSSSSSFLRCLRQASNQPITQPVKKSATPPPQTYLWVCIVNSSWRDKLHSNNPHPNHHHSDEKRIENFHNGEFYKSSPQTASLEDLQCLLLKKVGCLSVFSCRYRQTPEYTTRIGSPRI